MARRRRGVKVEVFLFSESIEGARIAFSGFAKRRKCFAPAISLSARSNDC